MRGLKNNPEKYRMLCELSYSGKNNAEISRIMGVSKSTIGRCHPHKLEGITVATLKVLAAVYTAPHAPTRNEVARVTGVTLRTIGRVTRGSRYIAAIPQEGANMPDHLMVTQEGINEIYRRRCSGEEAANEQRGDDLRSERADS